MKSIVSLAALAAAIAATSAAAQTNLDVPLADDSSIVVTGTRAADPVRIDQSGSAITVIDRTALEERQVRQVSDVLRDVPGVAVSRIAGQTQVRLRGSEANQVLVLVDGIEVSDPFAGEFDFGTLPADKAARIEVLRGPQSALYGSDAIGGVIQYVTASGRDVPGLTMRVEGGSFGTLNAAARAAGVAGDLDYALTGTLNTTDGTPNARGGRRDIGTDSGAAALKASWAPAANARLTGVVRYGRTDADFNDTDGNPASATFGQVIDTPGNHVVSEGFYALLRGSAELLDGRWSHALTAQLADITRDGYGASGRSYGNAGGRVKGSYETTLTLGGDSALTHAITFALDAERERFRNTDPSGFAFTGKRRTDNVGIVGQYRIAAGERAAITASLRHDANDRFADTTTYRIEGNVAVASATRLRAAIGSGVKNPGYYELFGYIDGRFIGNPGLKPEKSEGWEAGAEQRFAGDRVTLGGSFFHQALKDEIYTTYPAPAFIATPANRTSKSRQNGIETYLNARIGTAWRIDAAYTYLHAREAGLAEVRRPAHIASLATAWRAPGDRGGLTAIVRYNGRTDDVAFTDPSYVPVRVRLDDYTLVNLAGDWALTKQLSVFARVENLLAERYEDVFSFANPRRSAYAGVRARF